eukprot:239644_1
MDNSQQTNGFQENEERIIPQRTQFDTKSAYSHGDLTTNTTTENVNNAVCEKTRNRPRKMDANRFMTQSTTKKIQKRKNKNAKSLTKRGAIYHSKQRESTHKLILK